MEFSKQLAKIALDIGAIKLSTEKPFTWASGYRMPVYNDNRLLLGNADHRQLVAQAMENQAKKLGLRVDVVAGTATAGIPPATTLANLLGTPLIYVRSAPKAHGLQNQIEGVLRKGQSVVVVEDLVSTGGSVLKAVEAIRTAGGHVDHCFCIFDYGFQQSRDQFQKADCQLHSILNFPTLVRFALENGNLTENQNRLLEAWYADPFGWSQPQGI